MKTTQTIKITGVRRKKSVRENVYLEVDFVEVDPDFDHEFDNVPKAWANIYHPVEHTKEYADALVDETVEAVLSFYTESRKHEDKTYTDIKMHIVSYELQ